MAKINEVKREGRHQSCWKPAADEKNPDPVLARPRDSGNWARVMGGKGMSGTLAALWNDPRPALPGFYGMRIERDFRTANGRRDLLQEQSNR